MATDTPTFDYQRRHRDPKLAGKIVQIIFWSIVIPGALIGIIWSWTSFPTRPKTAIRDGISEYGNAKAALATFEVDNLRFPTTAEGLQALIAAPAGLTSWRGPYIESVPEDKWGTPFQYLGPDAAPDGEFQLHSAGSDRIFGTSDDVVIPD